MGERVRVAMATGPGLLDAEDGHHPRAIDFLATGAVTQGFKLRKPLKAHLSPNNLYV